MHLYQGFFLWRNPNPGLEAILTEFAKCTESIRL